MHEAEEAAKQALEAAANIINQHFHDPLYAKKNPALLAAMARIIYDEYSRLKK